MSNIVIDIAAEFTGKKAFKSADTSAQQLAKSAKKLGAALGIAFSTRAIVQYVKMASVAAAQDQKAQKLLAVNLKNLGLAYANADSERFIASLEQQTTILDDELRPAYAQLARTTGSISVTQKLMTVAFDASNGAGLGYAQTIDILSQAYVGNKKGLKQLNLGLTNADLAAMSFDEILTVITNKFAGAGAESLRGYAGDMAKLDVATANAAETLGKAFLDKFKAIAGGGDINRATSKIDDFSQALAGLVRVMFDYNAMNNLMDQVKFGGFLGLVPQVRFPNGPAAQSPADRANIDKANKIAAAKLAADKKAAAALAALAAASAKKKALAEKKSEALSKAAAAFDINRINIAAALRATMDADTILRLKAMQAIEDDNGELALKYLEQLDILQKSVQTAKLAGITTINAASLASLNSTLLAELAAIDKTEMAEDDKRKARDAAFAKYNDAITKQGGLAALNEYNERTQIQLTSIAKLAAIANTSTALATLNTVMTSNEKAIALTQSANDLARYTALEDYIALLGVAYNAAIALAQASAGKAVPGGKPFVPPGGSPFVPPGGSPFVPNPIFPGAGSSKDEKDAKDDVIAAIIAEVIPAAEIAAAAATDNGTSVIAEIIAAVVPHAAIAAAASEDAANAIAAIANNTDPTMIDWAAIYAAMASSSGVNDRGGSPDNITVNINAGVIASQEEFVALVQDAVQVNNRRGNNLEVAGII